jgi:hypothetical protein
MFIFQKLIISYMLEVTDYVSFIHVFDILADALNWKKIIKIGKHPPLNIVISYSLVTHTISSIFLL